MQKKRVGKFYINDSSIHILFILHFYPTQVKQVKEQGQNIEDLDLQFLL